MIYFVSGEDRHPDCQPCQFRVTALEGCSRIVIPVSILTDILYKIHFATITLNLPYVINDGKVFVLKIVTPSVF